MKILSIVFLAVAFVMLIPNHVLAQNEDLIVTIKRDTINCEIEKLKKEFIVFSVRGVIDTLSTDSVHLVNKQYWINPRYYSDLIPVNYTPVQYSVVFYIDSVGVKELYPKVLKWFSREFNSPYDGIQMANEETGVIVAKGTRHYSHSSRDFGTFWGQSFEGKVGYTIRVECRENRFKVEMFDFIDSDLGLLTNQSIKKSNKRPHEYTGKDTSIKEIYDEFFDKQWTYCKADIRMFATSMIQSLKYATRDLKTLDESDDW